MYVCIIHKWEYQSRKHSWHKQDNLSHQRPQKMQWKQNLDLINLTSDRGITHTLPCDIKFVTDLNQPETCVQLTHTFPHTTDQNHTDTQVARWHSIIYISILAALRGQLVDLNGWPAEVVLLGDSTLDNERPIFSGRAASLNKDSGAMWGPTLWTCYGSIWIM